MEGSKDDVNHNLGGFRSVSALFVLKPINLILVKTKQII